MFRAQPRRGPANNCTKRSLGRAWLLLVALCSCERRDVAQQSAQALAARPTANAAPSGAPEAVPLAAAPTPSAVTEEPRGEACPDDMVLVEGEFCPEAEQHCVDPPSADGDEDAVCRRFAEPSRCLSPKRELKRFCIDRYEWPNRAREKPRVLTQWGEAQQLCAGVDKRLCAETEWLFACEGEAMLPFTTGFERDPTACVVDRLYVQPVGLFLRWEACQKNPKCVAAFGRVDQREAAGSFARCRSPFGVFDMNGNVNEWVEVPGFRYPKRSGLKGGWWGPVRNRCRPTVRFHKEDDWGYEVGFRCCRNASP